LNLYVLAKNFQQAFNEYLDNEAETSASKTSDGWIRTGDIGSVDEYTNIVLIDRIKDAIKVGHHSPVSLDIMTYLTHYVPGCFIKISKIRPTFLYYHENTIGSE